MILFLQGVIKNMSLGERLRSLRIKNKLTQSELAENIMATNTSISNWEKGLSRPNRNMIALISKVFNVSPFELIGDYNLNDIEELKEKTKMN
jgi:transcriptional regulator with XRE-family HTH domain